MKAPETIHAFWCRFPSNANFGDALTPWIIRKITGHYPVFSWPAELVQKYIVMGSIIQYAQENCTVWGAGIMSRDDTISPKAKLLMVRGPLTRRRALECGADCPDVYGDPALLLPMLYQPLTAGIKTQIGVIPHYFDKPKVAARWKPSARLLLIDIQQRVETVVNQITSCEYIVSSSLHGLIVANAYGLPSLWVEFDSKLIGDGSKFRDYFLSIGQEPYEPVQLGRGPIDPDKLVERMSPPRQADLNSLLEACPFRKNE
jgi:hypothetical protein